MKSSIATVTAVIMGAAMLTSAAFAATTFDKDGNLVLPKDRDRWITVGSTFALSYEGDGATSFNTVRLDPESYDAYVKTGKFPVGATFDLEIRAPQTEVAPAKGGTTQGKVIGRSMHVKDERGGLGTWTFYSYADGAAVGRPIARSQACYACHQAHAKDDTVFSQFYPTMTEARDRAVSR